MSREAPLMSSPVDMGEWTSRDTCCLPLGFRRIAFLGAPIKCSSYSLMFTTLPEIKSNYVTDSAVHVYICIQRFSTVPNFALV